MKRASIDSSAAPGAVDSVLDLVGNTPLLHLNRFSPEGGGSICAKLGVLQPGREKRYLGKGVFENL